MSETEAVRIIRSAGKYLCEDRRLLEEVAHFYAVDAALDPDPELHALAVLALVLARIVRVEDERTVPDGYAPDRYVACGKFTSTSEVQSFLGQMMVEE